MRSGVVTKELDYEVLITVPTADRSLEREDDKLHSLLHFIVVHISDVH